MKIDILSGDLKVLLKDSLIPIWSKTRLLEDVARKKRMRIKGNSGNKLKKKKSFISFVCLKQCSMICPVKSNYLIMTTDFFILQRIVVYNMAHSI